MGNIISFPGLGIGEFKVDPVAFSLFGREVRWYGVIICIGIIAAFCYTAYRTGKMGLAFDDLLDYSLITVPAGVIGSRLYFIAFEYFGEGHSYDSFLDAIAFWDGGLAIYGAIIGGAVAVISVSLFKKIKMLRFMDAVAPAVMIAQVFGRWGNFMNCEAFGGTTASPFRMCGKCFADYLFEKHLIDDAVKAEMLAGNIGVQPTFFIESLWNLIGFVLINVFYKEKKFDGQWLIAYIGWYGLGRGFIELLRTDSLCIPGTAVRISSLLGFVSFALCVIALILILRFRPKSLVPEGDIYLPGSKNSKNGKPVQRIIIQKKDAPAEETKPTEETAPTDKNE